MPDVPTPWIGLAALAAMFVLPFLPSWIFEGPRKSKHWPREHVCARCDGAWNDEHRCLPPIQPIEPSPQWELYRLPPPSTPALDLEKDGLAGDQAHRLVRWRPDFPPSSLRSTPSRAGRPGTEGA
jgi:hypothetical protein